MPSDLELAFARHYRGRHRPEDAFWWLTHADDPGPSSAPPAQVVFLLAAAQLEAAGQHSTAAAMLAAAFELLRADQLMANEALERAKRACCESRP